LRAGAAAGGEGEPSLLTMSTLTEDGVMAVKQTACDRLLNFRVELKVAGKRITDVLNRMHVAVPKNR
jgi:nucleolar GTP-binding protein